MEYKYPLSTPPLDEAEIDAVCKVIRSKWLCMGDVTSEFERKFATMLGVKHAFAVSNCTAALHLANLALGIGPGDEVICPALTFVATANASKYTGADVVFADSVSSEDLTIDVDDIISKITHNTKAISVVHYAGFSCNMVPIIDLASRMGIRVIEDCAHSPFVKCDMNDSTKFVGTIGDVGCFSFFANKNMTTGEGGMVTTNSDEIAEKIRLLRSHGMTSTTHNRHKTHTIGYDVVCLGYNYRIDEIRSAIGIVQLDKIEFNNRKRRLSRERYINGLKDNPNITIPFISRDIEYSAPHIMPVIVKNSPDIVRARLMGAGIQVSKHYELIPSFTLYKDVGFKSKIENIDGLMSLPLDQGLTFDDVDFICSVVNNAD